MAKKKKWYTWEEIKAKYFPNYREDDELEHIDNSVMVQDKDGHWHILKPGESLIDWDAELTEDDINRINRHAKKYGIDPQKDDE
jgi:uncharacterized membrane protein